MSVYRRFFVLFASLIIYGASAYAQGGACPSSSPLAGKTSCYFIAANGSDSNSGASESSPWLHAPGMPNCSGNCAAVTPAGGMGFIFRGGDSWHFGNSNASPYTGGTWNWQWSGSSSSCDTSDAASPVETSCIYVGVDTSWSAGSPWARPIMTGDNPTNTSAVGSCSYGNVGGSNNFVNVNNSGWAIFDNLEFTGMCQQTASSSSTGYLYTWNLYINESTASDGGHIVQNRYSNDYFHGWTHLAFSCDDSSGEPVGQCFSEAAIGGGMGTTIGPGFICDGGDSDPGAVGCILYHPAYLVYDSVFEHMSQIVVNYYHVWHDNVWQYYYPTSDGVAHGNSFESNVDAPGCDSEGNCQPSVPFNAFYNNVFGHNSTGTAGDVKLWFCPNNTAAEYQFNNIVYDQGTANNWDIDTSCSGSNGHVYQFNNTFDAPNGSTMNCAMPGQAATNIHVITESGNGYASGSCTTSNLTVMSHATAVSQGYMANGTGTSGNNSNVTCANDAAPCVPTSGSSATVGAGSNLMSYCNTLLASNDAIIQRAGAACELGTTAGVIYNGATHTVSYPATPTARPTSGSWDTGAYQYSSTSKSGPPAPRGLTTSVSAAGSAAVSSPKKKQH